MENRSATRAPLLAPCVRGSASDSPHMRFSGCQANGAKGCPAPRAFPCENPRKLDRVPLSLDHQVVV